MSWLAGNLLERPPGPKYTEALSFAELCPRGPLPKAATFAKWRRQLPSGFQMALRAPARLWDGAGAGGTFPSGEALQDGVRWVAASAGALEAAFVVIAPSGRLTTGQRDRDRLAELIGALREHVDAPIVWLPGGLWEHATAERFAAKIGARCGLNGTDIDAALSLRAPHGALSPGPTYTFFSAEGARRSFSPSILAEHAENLAAGNPEQAFTTIVSHRSFNEAKTLQELFHAAHSRESDDPDAHSRESDDPDAHSRDPA